MKSSAQMAQLRYGEEVCGSGRFGVLGNVSAATAIMKWEKQ